MASYNLRIYFENLPNATNTLGYFGGNIYSPVKNDDESYELIGTWGSSSVVLTGSYYLDGKYHLSGYIETTITEPAARDYTLYDYILLAPSSVTVGVKRYMALPIEWIRYGRDGIADIQPAFSDFYELEGQ